MRRSTFLRHRRVELDAMSADVFVRFLERKLSRSMVSTRSSRAMTCWSNMPGEFSREL
jgi:hypothetical protein